MCSPEEVWRAFSRLQPRSGDLIQNFPPIFTECLYPFDIADLDVAPTSG
jgi:hypothetical protein